MRAARFCTFRNFPESVLPQFPCHTIPFCFALVLCYQGHLKTIFGEICVRQIQTVLRISVLRCRTATDYFTKRSPKSLETREK